MQSARIVLCIQSLITNSRDDGVASLLQAELMEFRVAWLEANQARLKALEYQEKAANALRNLNQRQLELQESQAPVKCAHDPALTIAVLDTTHSQNEPTSAV